jgi:hypothetical protein
VNEFPVCWVAWLARRLALFLGLSGRDGVPHFLGAFFLFRFTR